jgi:hypothetical protein
VLVLEVVEKDSDFLGRCAAVNGLTGVVVDGGFGEVGPDGVLWLGDCAEAEGVDGGAGMALGEVGVAGVGCIDGTELTITLVGVSGATP